MKIDILQIAFNLLFLFVMIAFVYATRVSAINPILGLMVGLSSLVILFINEIFYKKIKSLNAELDDLD